MDSGASAISGSLPPTQGSGQPVARPQRQRFSAQRQRIRHVTQVLRGVAPAPRCIRPPGAVRRFAAWRECRLRAARYRTCHREGASTAPPRAARPRGAPPPPPPPAPPAITVEVRVPMSTSPLPLHAGSSLPAVAPAAAPPMGADMGFGQGFAQPETGVDWRRVLSAVARFKWLITVVTVVGTVGGLAATRFIKPQY